MANKSGWKDSERRAALLFPGGVRRTRVSKGTYAEIADDVLWGPEHSVETTVFVKVPIKKKVGKKRVKTGEFRRVRMQQPRIIKDWIDEDIPPVYIEVKKRAKIEAVTFFRESETKYFQGETDNLVLVLHMKRDQRQFVMLSDTFFKQLFELYCLAYDIGDEGISNKEDR